MAEAFNLTAQLNLRGPSNIRQIVSDVKKQIGTITGEVKFKIDSSSINNTSKLNQSLQALNTNLSNVASNAASASSAIRNFGQSVSGLGNSSAKLSSNIEKAAKSTDHLGTVSSKASKNVAVARTEMEEFGRQSALAVRRFAAFSAVTGVFFSLSRAVNSGLKSFIEFDRQLVRLQQVTGQNAQGLKGLQDEISRLSIGLGVSSDSLIQVSSTLAQAGLSASQTRAALEALAKSELAPSFDNINQTVEGSIALMRQFGISANQLEQALGSVNAVAAAFAVESGDIIAAIQRTGGVFASASKGVSEGTDALNEFIAVFTSVRATTRESAETIATGLRTIFTRIQRAGAIEALKEFGVTLTDAEGKFVGAYKAVELLSQGLNRIDPRDLRFSQIVEELGGFRQIGKVIPLIQQFATAQEALKVAQAGQGSLSTDAAKAQLSLANQISKVREEFLTLIRGLGQSDTFQTLAKGALGFASGLIKISGALKGILPALTILAAGASLRGLTQFTGGFIGGLKKVPQGGPGNDGQSVAGAIGSNLGATLVGAKTEQVSRDLDQNSVALDRVSGKLDNLTAGLNSLDTNLNSINNSLNAYNSILQQSIASLNSNTSSLDRLTDAINNLDLSGGGAAGAKDGGIIRGFARGGSISRYAGGSSRGVKQSVPAMVSNKEGYVSAKDVKKVGIKKMDDVNKGKIPVNSLDVPVSQFKGAGGPRADKIGPLNLEQGSYVIRASSMTNRFSNKLLANNKNKSDNLKAKIDKYSVGGGVISDYGGAPANTTIVDSSDNNIGIADDTFQYMGNFDPNGIVIKIFYDKNNGIYSASTNGGNTIPINPKDIDSLFQNNIGSTRTFEEISAAVLQGGPLNSNDPNYPIDFSNGSQLYDAKFSEIGSYPEKDAVKKVLNYKLDTAQIGYGYNKNKQKLTISGSPPNLLGTNLTSGSDSLQAPETFSFVYPEFENIQTADISNVSQDLEKRIQQSRISPSPGKSSLTGPQLTTKQKATEAIALYKPDPQGNPTVSEVSGTKNIIELLRPYDYTPQKTGGLIQKFGRGSVGGVEAKAGRKPKTNLTDITMKQVEQMPPGQILNGLGGAFEAVKIAGVPVSGTDILAIMKKRQSTPKESVWIEAIRKEYLKKYNTQAAANRGQAIAATAQASSKGLLFGAVGMFGNPFTAENVTLTEKDGLKKSTDVRVFGAVLDKDKAAREARLQKENRIEKINDRRVRPEGAGAESGWRIDGLGWKKGWRTGKNKLRDTFVSDIGAAPIASDLAKEYTQEEMKGATKRSNKVVIKKVKNALTEGKTKAFFDFDKTLAYNTDPIGYKKDKKGNPDYTLFGDKTAVREGLFKNPARPTKLLTNIIGLINKTTRKLPDQLPSLLDSIHVVTARPSGAVDPIHEWLVSQGLSLPIGNIKGVGGVGMSAKDVAVAKANEILSLAGSDPSLFVDDDDTNLTAARTSGIDSLKYGAKLKLNRATKKAISDIQGGKFENDVMMQLEQTDPLLYAAMSQQAESHRSIDFPYGLGTKIANGWFGNPLLADIPVDAKRTLDGPRGAIKKNIINYLKAKGYNDGGIVQHFKDAGEVEAIKGVMLGKGRGVSGPRASSGPRNFRILDTEEYLAFMKRAYREAGEYGGPGWNMRYNPPMPHVLTKYWDQVFKQVFVGIETPTVQPVNPNIDAETLRILDKEGEIVYGTGKDPTLPQGAPGYVTKSKGFAPFRYPREKQKKSPRRTDLRNFRNAVAAAGGIDPSQLDGVPVETLEKYAERTLRSTPESFKATIERYSTDPEFIKQEPMAAALLRGEASTSDTKINLDTVLQKVKAFVRGGSFAGVFNPEQAAKVKKAIERLKAQNEPKTKAALENFDSIIAGGTPETDFHKTAFQWAMNRVFKEGPIPLRDGGSVQRFMAGGYKLGGDGTVPALVSNNEGYVPPITAKSIGYGTLNKMNQADRNGMGRFSRGGISKFKGPGTGTSDSIRTNLPVGSYVIRAKAMNAMGFNKGGAVGVQRFAGGGSPKPQDVGTTSTIAGFDLGDDMLKRFAGSVDKLTDRFLATVNIMSLGSFDFLMTNIGVAGRGLAALEHNLKILDRAVPGLAEAIIQNGLANQRSIIGQDSLVSGLFKLDDANLALAKSTLEADTARRTASSSVPTSPPDSSTTSPAVNNSSQTSNTTLSKAERKARKEAYTSQSRGGVTREDARKQGLIRSDFGEGQPSNPRVEKQKQKYIEDSTKPIKDELKPKYQQLFDEEKQAIKAYYTAKVQQAQKEGKDVSGIISEYRSAVSDAKASMEAALRGEFNERVQQNTLPKTDSSPAGTDYVAIDKQPAEAANQAARELELLSTLASQSGMSLKDFTQDLQKQIGSAFIKLKDEMPKLIGSVRANVVQNRDKLTSSDAETKQNAAQSLGEDVRRAIGSSSVSGISNEQIDQFVADLQNKLQNTSMSFDEAINSVSGLKDALSDASSEAKLQARAVEAVAASSGAAKNTLDNMAEAAINNAKAIKESEKLSSRLAKTALAVGAAGSALSSIVKAIGGSQNKSAVVSGAAIEGASSTFSTLTAARSQALPTLDAASAMASKMGGPIGKLGSTLLPMVKNLIAGPFGLIATGAISLAGALKDAYNAARDFDLEQTKKRLDESISRVNNLFDEFSKDTSKLDILGKIDQELRYGSQQLIKNLQTDLTVPKAFWINLLDVGLSSSRDQAQAAGRSMILEKEGSLSYMQASLDSNYQQRAIARLAPEKAVETAQKAQPQGQNILRQFENRLRSGSNMDDLLADLKIAGNESAQVLARMNPKINEQIMLLQNDNTITEQNRKAQIQQIVAAEATRVATVNMKNTMKQIEFEKLGRQTNNFAASLERMFNNMEQSINKVGFDLDKLSRSAELSAAALNGNAKAGEIMLDSINILQNPRAYSGSQQNAAYDQAAGMFGDQAGLIRPLLGLGDKLESTVMRTINQTVAANPQSTTEGIAGNIGRALEKQLKDLGLPPNIADKLAGQTRLAFEKIRSERGGEDTQLNFDQVAEEVPAFAKAISSAQRAQELAVKAMEFYQKNVNDYAQAMNQMVEYQVEANGRMRKASEIQTKGNMELSRTLGKRITLDDTRRATEAPIRSMTGGLTDPRDIGRNAINLENTRRIQQGSADSAANRGPAAKDEFALMQNRLRNTNTALRENIDALKQMADSTDLAQAALQKIQEVQAKRQAGANLIEKMVTSSPEELARLNASIGRLNNNMRGGLNIGSTSEQRGETLQAFNMIAPMLGDGQTQNELKANVLESMLKESGVGIDSTFQAVLDSLRNPEGDPQMAEAIGIYRDAVNKQAQANITLAELQRLMSENTAEIAATKLSEAIGRVTLTFDQTVMNDIRDKIQVLVDVVKGNAEDGKNPIPVQNRQKGGVIYASMGQAIDFAPKGTDTVPAMLTPGEFVVNRSATKANLPLLQNINSGKYSNGGKVRYYNDGGYVLSGGRSTDNMDKQRAAVEKKQQDIQKTKNVKKLPVIQDDAEKYLVPMGSLETDSFIAVGNNRQAGIGNIYKTIDIYMKDNWPYIDYFHIGSGGPTQSGSWGYTSDLFNGVPNISKIITDKEIDVDQNDEFKDIIKSYAEFYSLLTPGFAEGTSIEKLVPSLLKSTLPTIDPKITTTNEAKNWTWGERFSGRKKIASIDNVFDKYNKHKNFWGLFEDRDAPKSSSPGGIGLKNYDNQDGWGIWASRGSVNINEDKILADSSDIGRIAPGLEDTYSFKTRDGNQEGLDRNRGDVSTYAGNTMVVLKKIREAAKSLGSVWQAEKGIAEDDQMVATTESSEGIKVKNTMALLDSLYNKRVFSVDIDDPDYVQEAVTLYNLDQAQWAKIIPSIQDYQTLAQGNRAPKDNNNWTKVSKITDPTQTINIPWIAKSANIDPSIFASARQMAVSTIGQDILSVEQTPLGSERGKYFIPAQTVTAPFIDRNTRNFTDPQKYIYIAPDAGVPALNPFYNKTGKPIAYKGTKEALEALILSKLPKWDANTQTSTDPPNWPNITLDNDIGLVNSLTKDSYPILKDIPDDKIPFLLRSNGDVPVIESTAIDATAYSQGRDKRIEAAQLNQAKTNVEKVSGDRFNLSAEDKAFPAENRVKIAQAAQAAASSALGSYGITVPNISKIEDVGGVAGYLNSYLGRFDNKSPEWATIDSWRGLFSELFKPTPAAVGYLKSFGIESNGNGADADNFKKIINREIAVRVSKTVSGEIPAEAFANGKLELDSSKTKIYSVGKDGKRTLDQSEFAPKTIADIEKIALNPQNVFQDKQVRQNYLDALLGFWNTNASKYPGDIAKNFIDGIIQLKPWYTAQDSLLNTSLNQTDLDASLGLLSSEQGVGETIANQTTYEPFNQLLTGGQYGSLPDTNRLIDLIKVRKEEAKNEEQTKQAENPENFANGGLVYASNGTLVNFQPKGTDTVPAMLTPGEFVINRDSTQKYRPILEAINNGNYNRGGIVNYLQNGGYLPIYRGDGGGANGAGQKFDFTSYMGDIVSKIGSGITEAIDKAIQNVKSPNTDNAGVSSNSQDLATIDSFVNRLNNIANILSNIYIPPQITITGKHDVVVTINGDTVLNQLQPDIQGIVTSSIKQAFRNLKANNPENNTIDFNIDSPDKK